MTKKHYIEIAKIIDQNTGLYDDTIVVKYGLITDLCNMFHNDNERFSQSRFIEACYKTEGKE